MAEEKVDFACQHSTVAGCECYRKLSRCNFRPSGLEFHLRVTYDWIDLEKDGHCRRGPRLRAVSTITVKIPEWPTQHLCSRWKSRGEGCLPTKS